MIQRRTAALLTLLAVGILPIFASSEAGTNRHFLSLQTPGSHTKTWDDPQPGKSQLPENLRWVRGRVLSWASDSLTLQLKKGSLTLDLSVLAQVIPAFKGTQQVISAAQLKDESTGPDNEAKPDSLAVGARVQAHYFERDHKSYAILIFEETDSASKALKQSGSSYLGVFLKLEEQAIHLRANGRTRRIYRARGTTFVDSTGHRLPAREFKPGITLLITYRLDGGGQGMSWMPAALEIRWLTLR
jgi:hypothetical protein